ncbi:aryl-alcohol oxidase [Amylostereum chailletii]|nr:aryl-alcohol oxidase [Amylostereum chailletii]
MITLLLNRAFLALSFLPACLGAIYYEYDDVPGDQFDFVVIGGGPGGSVVANRLTEDPAISVLLLEAGGSPDGLVNYTVPLFELFLRDPNPRDWNYTTVPAPGLNGRTLHFPRGKILGGCTSMNGMVYVRGSSEDYDRYAEVTGDEGWSWESLQPYIRKNERWAEPQDHHNTTGQFDPKVHGFHGINTVTLNNFPAPTFDSLVQQATQELNDTFPFNLDTNSGFQLGVGECWQQATIKDGRRSSSATAYLGPQFIGRPNLHVLLNAQVTQLFDTSKDTSVPRFTSVEFSQNGEGNIYAYLPYTVMISRRTGARQTVNASKEVILSAGVVGTPQILILSGIGDSEALKALDIEPRVHIPDVGKNLSVHITVSVSFLVNSTDTYDDILRNATLRDELYNQWESTRQGPLSNTQGGHIGFTRMSANASIFQSAPDSAAGPNTAHFQLGLSNGMLSPAPTGYFVSGTGTLITPSSRGSVRLNTSSPFDSPLVDINSLATPFDIFALREAIKSTRRWFSAPAWEGYILAPFGPLGNATTDEEIEAYARANAAPNGHVVGTAAMSPVGARYGVVDPDLSVKGVQGVRVVDASVLPFVPAGNTQVPVYVLAERAADLIKAAWK